MSNKHFLALVFLILTAFFGWLFYDNKTSSDSILRENVHRGLLIGAGDGSSLAQIQYLFDFPNPIYSHALNTSQIEVLARGGGEDQHSHIYGLTQADYKMDTLYEFNYSKAWFKEEYTMWVEDVRVEFSYNSLSVYVTSNYPEGSCEYEQTLKHENQHVEIHRQVYAQYQKVLRDAVDNASVIPLSSHPLVVGSEAEGKEKIAKIVSGVVDPVFDQFRDALNAEQAKIDTPESYAGLKAQCGHW